MLTFRSRINSRDLENVREISASSGMFDEDDIDITVCLADDALYQLQHPEDDDYPHDTKFLFAEQNGKPCAYACYGEIADSDASYELYWLATHNNCRGQGIGKALVAELIKRLKKQIKNAKHIVESNDKPDRLDSNYFVKLYNTYKDKKYEYVMRNNTNDTYI